MKLAIEQVCYSTMEADIIHDVTVHVEEGQFIGVIGPNGSGKSTLLKTASRILKPDSGSVQMNGQSLYQLPAKKAAQNLAVVTQETALSFDFTVQEIVWMGRSPHKRLLQVDTEEDRHIVNEALNRVDMHEYKDRSFLSLSGGEKQRVLIARALAQQANIIILDEPTNHLDIRHQMQLLHLVKTLGLTVLAALHDLNLAAEYCDYLYVVQEGKIVQSGKPEQVLTKECLREVFGVEAEIIAHPVTKNAHIIFLQHIEYKKGNVHNEKE